MNDDYVKPLVPLDELKRHGARVYCPSQAVYYPSQAEIRAQTLKDARTLESLRTRHQRAVKQTRWAFRAVIFLGGCLVGLLVGFGIAALLGL